MKIRNTFPFKTGVILTATLLLASCNKKNETPDSVGETYCPVTNQYYAIESATLQNMNYKTGTYWNYIDSVNINTDSVYLSDYSDGSFQTSCSNSVQKYDITTTSSNTGEVNFFYIVPAGLSRDVSLEYNEAEVLFFEFDSGSTNAYDSLYVYDQYYYEVMKSEYIDPSTDHSFMYYINAEFGFLRIEEYDENNVLLSEKILTGKNIIR